MTARLHKVEWVSAFGLALLCVAVGVLAGIDPWMAVVAALGAGFLLLTFADLAAGLVVLVVVIFAETTPLAGAALSFTKLVGLVLVLAWLARLASRPAGSERLIFSGHPAFAYMLAAFLGWIAVSVSWAESTGDALTAGSRILLVIALYLIVYTAVQTRRQAFWVLGGLTTGAAGTAAYGLVLRPDVAEQDPARLVSTISDPNVLAAILVAGFALAGAGFVAARGYPGIRLPAAGAVALCLAALVLTGSRGGLVAFGAALAAAVIVGGRWRGKALVVTLTLVVGTLAYYTLYAPDTIRERVFAATQGEVASEEGRFTLWAVGWRMAEDHPVTGVGVGNFKAESAAYVLEPGTLFRTDRVIDTPTVAHNTYLQVLAELGIVGAALFLAIIGFSIATALKAARTFAARDDWRMEALARGVVVAVAGMLTAHFFISEVSNKVVWLLLALGPAMLAIANSKGPSDGGASAPRRA